MCCWLFLNGMNCGQCQGCIKDAQACIRAAWRTRVAGLALVPGVLVVRATAAAPLGCAGRGLGVKTGRPVLRVLTRGSRERVIRAALARCCVAALRGLSEDL